MMTADNRHDAPRTVDDRTTIRFGSWNVNGQRGLAVDAHLRLLHQTQCQVFALQEVTEDYYRTLKLHSLVRHAVHSLEIQPPAPDAPPNRRLGCAVVSTDPAFAIDAATLLDTHVCPERALVVDVALSGSAVRIGSFHSPNGSKWGRAKALWFRGVTAWLREQHGPTLFGIDANTPKQEGLSDDDPRKWWREDSHPTVGNAARSLVGDAPRHGLSDVWKALNPSPMRFPTSHNRDNRREKRAAFACRYDFVFASQHFTAVACEYHYDAVAGVTPRLSDHALVTATLRL